jgi:hypothetical protein
MTNTEIDEILGHWRELTLLDLDAFAAFIHRRHGDEACREFMKLRADDLEAREYFEEAADDLEDKGIDHVAQIVRDIASKMTWGLDLNPYSPGERGNWRQYRRGWFNRRRICSGVPKTTAARLPRDISMSHRPKTRLLIQ